MALRAHAPTETCMCLLALVPARPQTPESAQTWQSVVSTTRLGVSGMGVLRHKDLERGPSSNFKFEEGPQIRVTRYMI